MLEDTTVSDTVALLARFVVALVVRSDVGVVDRPWAPETAILVVACVGGRGTDGEAVVEEPGDDDSRAVLRARRGKALVVVADVTPRSRRGLLLIEAEGAGGEGGGEEDGIVIKLPQVAVVLCVFIRR